jgi:hypothetical protein
VIPIKATVTYIGANPDTLLEDAGKSLERKVPHVLAKRFKRAILNNIDNNVYGFKVSAFWAAVKKARGWGELPFVAEGYYRQAIRYRSEVGKFTVGFDEKKIHPRSQKMMLDIAIALENGILDKGLPARPLWRKTAEDFTMNIKQILIEELKDLVLKS